MIIGTPTYAIPAWLAKAYPEIMVTDRTGQASLRRQTDYGYHPFCLPVLCGADNPQVNERDCCRKNVIGYQLDNETKHYGTSSVNVQPGLCKIYQDEI